MTADLSGIRSLLAGITPGDYDSVVSADRKWALVLRSPGTADETIVAKCADDDEAAFFAAAPSTVARLLGIVERVEDLATYLETLADGDRHYAGLIRATLAEEGGA